MSCGDGAGAGACKDIYVPVQLFWAISLFV